MDRAYLRLVTIDGELTDRPLRTQPAPEPDALSEIEEAVAAASAVHDVVRRLQQAILEGDQVAIRAFARSAEFKAARGVRAAEKLRDLHLRAAG